MPQIDLNEQFQKALDLIEQGRTSPSIALLKRLAAALNTTLQVQFK